MYTVGGRSRQRRNAPTINWSNTNARAIFTLVGIPPDDLFGELHPSVIPDLLRSVIGALNSRVRRVPLDRVQVDVPASVSNTAEAKGARFIASGNTDEQTVRRLQAFQDLLVYAQKHNLPIGWS